LILIKYKKGKTTLLNALNFRSEATLNIQGRFRLNGKEINSYEEISPVSGYVQQTDTFISSLKVKEHLKFQVKHLI
jgi:ABC-type multidrug transport system ATPase subunit